MLAFRWVKIDWRKKRGAAICSTASVFRNIRKSGGVTLLGFRHWLAFRTLIR
jgi:hypothetical protein